MRNVGAYLEASTLVCRIAQPGELEAILAIDQEELDFVAAGQPVELLLNQLPGREARGPDRPHGRRSNAGSVPTRLTTRAGGRLATTTDASGVERPLSVVYQANVPLTDPANRIAIGATGLAKIHAGYQPLCQRLWRTACRTFRFEM